MARFSLGREEDDGEEGSGPSSPRLCPKKQKTASSATASTVPQPPRPAAPPPHDGGQEIEEFFEEEDQGEEFDEEESDFEAEEEEDDSDFELDEDDEDEVGEEESENQQVGVTEGSSGDGSISVILTDPDVFDCPICLEHLSIPVFQCENGHVACSSCCLKIRNRCPSCSWPIGYNRCRAIEKVLESVKVSCRNVKYGCKELMRYNNKHEHENLCAFAPCSCPFLDCNFVGSSWHLYVHFGCKHLTSAKRFLFNRLFSCTLEKNQRFLILQENGGGVIFILNHFSEWGGSVVNVVCIGPMTSRREFSYDLIARDGDTSIKLQSSVESIPKWVDCPPAKNFLLVPSCYYTAASGQLKLDVCIRKHQE